MQEVFEKIIERLKEQIECERTNYSEETYANIKPILCGKIGSYMYAIEIIQEEAKAYEDLEEQGLLLRLPCPIGTTVYLIDINDYFVLNEFIEEVPFELSMFDYVGKYVFLTKPEAEEALQKMREE